MIYEPVDLTSPRTKDDIESIPLVKFLEISGAKDPDSNLGPGLLVDCDCSRSCLTSIKE